MIVDSQPDAVGTSPPPVRVAQCMVSPFMRYGVIIHSHTGGGGGGGGSGAYLEALASSRNKLGSRSLVTSRNKAQIGRN